MREEEGEGNHTQQGSMFQRNKFVYTKNYCEENVYKFLERLQLMKKMEERKKEMGTAASSEEEKAANKKKKTFTVADIDQAYAVFVSSYYAEESKETMNEWTTSRVPYCPKDVIGDKKVQDECRMGVDHVMVWDYHVVPVVHVTKRGWFVLDFDAHLDSMADQKIGDFALPFETWYKKTLTITDDHQEFTRSKVRPLQKISTQLSFRFVEGRHFLHSFRSDRSHMWEAKMNDYHSPPPSYKPISEPSPLAEQLADGEEAKPSKFPNMIVSFINMENKSIPGHIVKTQEVLEWLTSKIKQH